MTRSDANLDAVRIIVAENWLTEFKRIVGSRR
jgi:hypothetical protein